MQFNFLCRKMRKYVLFFGNRWQMTGTWAEQTLHWLCPELLYWRKVEGNWGKKQFCGEEKQQLTWINLPSEVSWATNRHMQPACFRASPLRWPQFPTDLRVYVFNRKTPTRLWGHCGSRRWSLHILRFPVCYVLSPKPTLLFSGLLDGFSSLFLGGWVETLAGL